MRLELHLHPQLLPDVPRVDLRTDGGRGLDADLSTLGVTANLVPRRPLWCSTWHSNETFLFSECTLAFQEERSEHYGIRVDQALKDFWTKPEDFWIQINKDRQTYQEQMDDKHGRYTGSIFN